MAQSQVRDLEEELVFDEDDFRPYNMSPNGHTNTGICLVFNNIYFTDSRFRPRPGSAVDFQRIKRVFQQFGFRVDEKRNCTAANMMDCLRRTAAGYNCHYCAFICFFLSHGKEDTICDRDGRMVKISDLIQMFVDYCPQMADKPKLFFVQICRNCEEEQGATANHRSTKTAAISIFPCDKDILISFATTSGRVAYSADNFGAPYIEKLTKVLKERGHKDSIFDVLKVTRRLVEESVAIKNKEMCPEFVSTLTRPLVFTLCLVNLTHRMTQVALDEEDNLPQIAELGLTLRLSFSNLEQIACQNSISFVQLHE